MSRRVKRPFAGIALLICLNVNSLVFSQAPNTISYQGALQNGDGSSFENGQVDMTISVFDAPMEGNLLWSETQTVPVLDGIFNVILGKNQALNLPFDAPYWLGISVNGGDELLPRTELTASPYSFHAESIADSSVSTVKIQANAVTTNQIAPDLLSSINGVSNDGGNIDLVPGSNVNIIPDTTNKTITISATSGIGGGAITAVVAGDGLSGGGTAGDVSLSIAENGVDSDKIANNTVVRSLNNITDSITLRGAGGATISTQNDTIVINAGIGGETNGWSLSGNDELTEQQFLGTTDSSAMNFRVNNHRVLRLEPSPENAPRSPNIIGGSIVNSVSQGVKGATISGGGADSMDGSFSNTISGDYGTISGGHSNLVADFAGSIGGGVRNAISGDYSTIGGGNGNEAGTRATVAGGWSNDAGGDYATIGGGFTNLANGFRAVVAGGSNNKSTAQFTSITGGFNNEAGGDYSTIGGGNSNTASATFATIAGGGASNPSDNSTANNVTDNYGTVGGGGNNQAGDAAGTTADAAYATVSGGWKNQAYAAFSTISGGGAIDEIESLNTNRVYDNYGTIGGGGGNQAGDGSDNDPENAQFATVAGGARNQARGSYSFIGGGNRNQAGTPFGIGTIDDVPYATITGGLQNRATGHYTSIGGGYLNNASSDYGTVAGGVANRISASFGTISGGGWTEEDNQTTGNRVTDDYGTIGGGGDNQAGNDSGTENDAFFSTVSGGQLNTASGRYSTVGGGGGNQASSDGATTGGGQGNQASGSSSTISGGSNNQASGTYSTIAGGSLNIADGIQRATIGGGGGNQASGNYSTVPGGGSNIAGGDFSLAAGFRAQANHRGAFVWADNPPVQGDVGVVFSSTGDNQFLIRAEGGVGIGSNNPQGGLLILNELAPPAGLAVDNNGLMLGIQSTAGYKWIQSYGGSLILNPISNNVGIGVTNPTNILTVRQNSSTDPIADAWTTYSSRRWKTNIETIRDPLEKVNRLRGVTYNWKKDGKYDIGLIAEEVGDVLPEIVAYEENGIDAKSVDYARIVALLIESVKMQQKQINKQQEEIETLKSVIRGVN